MTDEPTGEVVQHANARTEYKLIVHEYDPDHCRECHRIWELCQEGGR